MIVEENLTSPAKTNFWFERNGKTRRNDYANGCEKTLFICIAQKRRNRYVQLDVCDTRYRANFDGLSSEL